MKTLDSDKITTPCVILAGGKSSRLGTDKTQIDFRGTPLSQWVHTRLSEVFSSLYVSIKHRDKFSFDAQFLIESSPIYAPIVGMINAFESLDSEEIIFFSVDTPFVLPQTLRAIAHSKAQISYAQSTDKAHYLISKWHRSSLESLLWAYRSKNYALYRIIESHSHEGICASDEECFNINTMEDYHKALAFYEAH